MWILRLEQSENETERKKSDWFMHSFNRSTSQSIHTYIHTLLTCQLTLTYKASGSLSAAGQMVLYKFNK